MVGAASPACSHITGWRDRPNMSFVSHDDQPAAPVGHETYWERQARTRWGRYLSEIERQSIMFGHAAAPAPNVVLDVGADGGRWSRVLCAQGWRAVCIDIDERKLALCQSRLPNATCAL